MKYTKVLGIDFGTAKLGLALLTHGLPEPLQLLPVSSQLFLELTKIAQEYAVEAIVVGVSEGKTADDTLEFIAQLRTMTHIPILITDETLTTQDAQRAYAHVSKKYPDDVLAACLILEQWYDSQSDKPVDSHSENTTQP